MRPIATAAWGTRQLLDNKSTMPSAVRPYCKCVDYYCCFLNSIDRSTHTLMPTRTTVPKGVKAWINSSSVGRSSGSRVDHVTFNALCFTSLALLVTRPSILLTGSKISTVEPERKVCARRSWACQNGAYIYLILSYHDDTRYKIVLEKWDFNDSRMAFESFRIHFCLFVTKDQNVLILTVLLSCRVERARTLGARLSFCP